MEPSPCHRPPKGCVSSSPHIPSSLRDGQNPDLEFLRGCRGGVESWFCRASLVTLMPQRFVGESAAGELLAALVHNRTLFTSGPGEPCKTRASTLPAGIFE